MIFLSEKRKKKIIITSLTDDNKQHNELFVESNFLFRPFFYPEKLKKASLLFSTIASDNYDYQAAQQNLYPKQSPRTKEEALEYIYQVKCQLVNYPATYNYFLDLLTSHDASPLNKSLVSIRILFQNYPELWLGFKRFLRK